MTHATRAWSVIFHHHIIGLGWAMGQELASHDIVSEGSDNDLEHGTPPADNQLATSA